MNDYRQLGESDGPGIAPGPPPSERNTRRQQPPVTNGSHAT